MSSERSSTHLVRAPLVLGQSTPINPAEEPATFAAFAIELPTWEPRTIFTGIDGVFAGRFRRPSLLGLSLGEAVVRALLPEGVKRLTRCIGYALTPTHLIDLLDPLLTRASCGEVVIAGVRSPPDPAPRYTAFAPHALAYWRFDPGSCTALPTIAGGADFVLVRVFDAQEWAQVERAGGVLPAPSLTIEHEPIAPSTSLHAMPENYRTGAPGKPSSIHLVEMEMRARAMRGELRDSVGGEAVELLAWLKREHPRSPSLTAKTIGNRIGSEYRRLRTCPI